MDALAPFVPLLSFEAQGGDRPGLQASEADGLTRLFAIAVVFVFDSAQGLINLRDQLALPISCTQFKSTICFG